MIFPILDGWLGPARAPVTWLLIFLNVAVFSVTRRLAPDAQAHLEDVMRDDYFVTAQGRAYAAYLGERAGQGLAARVGERVADGDVSRAPTLGQLAFRDPEFLAEADALSPAGDEVAFRIWKRRLRALRDDQAVHPSFVLGLSAADDGLGRWVTYIFVHSGGLHLFGNMLFLLLFGAALEVQLGGLAVLLSFVGGGVVGAGVFASVTGVTGSPLVGASGAVSGVMALFCVLNWTRPVRFVWLALPRRGYFGLTLLPAWVILLLWGAADAAGLLSTVPELGGVAYAAHLGGDLAGVAVAVGLNLNRPPKVLRGPDQHSIMDEYVDRDVIRQSVPTLRRRPGLFPKPTDVRP